MNSLMTRNMGPIERVIRLIAGVAVLGLYGALPSPWRYLTLIGLALIATSLTGRCLLYSWIRRPGSTTGAGS